MNYSKKTPIDFDKVVGIYNNEGREFAQKHLLNEYDMNLNIFFRRIKQETNYSYRRKEKRFVINDTGFISIDDLCANKRVIKTSELVTATANNTFEHLLFELMKDKLGEINKYIKLETSSRSVIVDLRSLNLAGYNVKFIEN